VSAAAALATIDVLSEPGVYSGLYEAGAQLRLQMAEALKTEGEAGQILGDGPLAQVAFSAKPVTDQRTWLASDRARGRAVMLALLKAGVFLNPMGTKLYLSLAHDAKAIEVFVGHFAHALAATRKAGKSAKRP
jgi:glutamate-1-semialdehyde 2,1-aminomutase